MEEYLRTYCEIDLKAIRENYINIKKKTGDNAMTMAVIKADGYGHGAVEVAHYLNDIADYFGVATIDEGVELRKAGLKQPILLLGYNSPSLYYKNLEYGVDQTIYCYDTAKAMSEAAVKTEKTARIHIALDTGMTRIGLSPDEKGLAIVKQIAELPNVTIRDFTTMVDIVTDGNRCLGIIARDSQGRYRAIQADETILASGGVGGLYDHSTNFPHLTGDALAIAMRHGVELEHIDYVQIHPTSLYSKKPGRSFLISESVRGEGAKLRGKDGQRFANEVLPRDLMTAEIRKQMKKDDRPFVWLDMTVLGEDVIKHHFPHIYERCLEDGIDATKDWVPVTPAQHYFMGGIHVDKYSQTTMDHLYAVGETSCNGVHGRNRLASNSLLESLVFGKRAAQHIVETEKQPQQVVSAADFAQACAPSEAFIGSHEDTLAEEYRRHVLGEMERERECDEQRNHEIAG